VLRLYEIDAGDTFALVEPGEGSWFAGVASSTRAGRGLMLLAEADQITITVSEQVVTGTAARPAELARLSSIQRTDKRQAQNPRAFLPKQIALPMPAFNQHRCY
jgi:hypothetical protein